MKQTKETKKIGEKSYRGKHKNLISHISHLTSDPKGITLIALVITIIVMLILLTFTIKIVTNAGIFRYTGKAVDRTEVGQDIEKINVAVREYDMKEMLQKEQRTLAEFLETKEWCKSATEMEDSTIIITTQKGRTYKIQENKSVIEYKGISLSKSIIEMEKPKDGEATQEITANLHGINGEITWSIEDETIATISPKTENTVVINAVAEGNTTITATCGEYMATCKIKITVEKTIYERIKKYVRVIQHGGEYLELGRDSRAITCGFFEDRFFLLGI